MVFSTSTSRFLPWSCLLLVAITLGCSKSTPTPSDTASSDSSAAGSNKKTIGFSALTLKNPFFKVIGDSLAAEAEKHGYTVVINDADRDVTTQAKHIDDYIAQNVTAIVLNPTDRVAIGTAIERANKAGIPVFTCDLMCEAEGIKIAGHVGTDNFQGGRLAGTAMIEALGEEGGDVLILHFKQANSCVLRVEGFNDSITAHNKDRAEGKISVVAELEGGGLQDIALRATADAIQAHPNLRGIFAINDPSAIGAWTALSQAGKQDQVKIVGFDGQLIGKEAIRDGKIYADPIQFPEKMGTITMENILKYINGEEFDQEILIETKLYRREDAANDPELQ